MRYEKQVDSKTNDTIIKLFGEVDSYNAQELRECLSIDSPGNLIIDCEELSYIDSTGLGVLVSVLKKIDGCIKIIHLKPHLYRIFELTSLNQLFEIEVS